MPNLNVGVGQIQRDPYTGLGGGSRISSWGGRGTHLKRFGVFRVKNHDFTSKNHIFSNFRGARVRCTPLDPPLGLVCVDISAMSVCVRPKFKINC